MADEHRGGILDEEEVAVEVRRPVGGIVSVRFNDAEMRELRTEVNLAQEKVSSFIKQAVRSHIAQRRAERDFLFSVPLSTGHLVQAGLITAGFTAVSGSGSDRAKVSWRARVPAMAGHTLPYDRGPHPRRQPSL